MSRKHSTALGFGTALAGAAVAAFIGMGTANATGDDLTPDGYSDLFGSSGPQAFDDASLDHQLFVQNPADAAAFDTAVDRFEASETHPLVDLIHALDPSAFTTQFDPDIVGTVGGGYYVPDDGLGYLAQELDFFLLTPTGLGSALGPVIDILLASPPSF